MSAGATLKARAQSMWVRFREALAESHHRAISEAPPLHPPEVAKLVLATLLAGFCLAIVYRYGQRSDVGMMKDLLEGLGFSGTYERVFAGKDNLLWRYGYWTGSVLLFYAFIPGIFARFFPPRESLSDYGLSPKKVLSHWWIYVGLYVIFFGVMMVVATRRDFNSYYPMYRPARESLGALLSWELIYLPQFFAVEFFFRGFLIQRFRRLGGLAILMPLVPYCMLHFGKPFPEVLGALIAGLVLGTIAFMTRTIWLGVFLHMSAALSMDVAALIARDTFPTRF